MEGYGRRQEPGAQVDWFTGFGQIKLIGSIGNSHFALELFETGNPSRKLIALPSLGEAWRDAEGDRSPGAQVDWFTGFGRIKLIGSIGNSNLALRTRTF
jgi:hypothetical protein